MHTYRWKMRCSIISRHKRSQHLIILHVCGLVAQKTEQQGTMLEAMSRKRLVSTLLLGRQVYEVFAASSKINNSCLNVLTVTLLPGRVKSSGYKCAGLFPWSPVA